MKQISYFWCNFKTTEPILIILSPRPKSIEAKLNAISFTKIGPVVTEKFADKFNTHLHTYTNIERRSSFILKSDKKWLKALKNYIYKNSRKLNALWIIISAKFLRNPLNPNHWWTKKFKTCSAPSPLNNCNKLSQGLFYYEIEPIWGVESKEIRKQKNVETYKEGPPSKRTTGCSQTPNAYTSQSLSSQLRGIGKSV